MYGSVDFGPSVVALASVHHHVTTAERVDHKVLASEARGYGVLLPECPVSVLHMHCKHWRVMGDLEGGGIEGLGGGGFRGGK